jgi:hypothetical protein
MGSQTTGGAAVDVAFGGGTSSELLGAGMGSHTMGGASLVHAPTPSTGRSTLRRCLMTRFRTPSSGSLLPMAAVC